MQILYFDKFYVDLSIQQMRSSFSGLEQLRKSLWHFKMNVKIEFYRQNKAIPYAKEAVTVNVLCFFSK